MSDFKPGDRVRLIDGDFGEAGNRPLLQTGTAGTILQPSEHVCSVCWDKDINGHSCMGRCEDGHGWVVEAQNLELDHRDFILTDADILLLLGGETV